MTCWPSVSVSDLAASRAITSAGPPGGKGTIRRMLRPGKLSAHAPDTRATLIARAAAIRRMKGSAFEKGISGRRINGQGGVVSRRRGTVSAGVGDAVEGDDAHGA